MGGTKGNTNAVKWTAETVVPMLEKIEKEAKKPTCLWLGSALVKVGLYREIWSYWSEKFAENKVVFQTIKKVEQIFEDRIYKKALSGKVNATVAIFGLKNNHKWTDKREFDHTTGGRPFKDINIKIIGGKGAPITSEDEIDADI